MALDDGRQFCRFGCACAPACGSKEASSTRLFYGRVGNPALPKGGDRPWEFRGLLRPWLETRALP